MKVEVKLCRGTKGTNRNEGRLEKFGRDIQGRICLACNTYMHKALKKTSKGNKDPLPNDV